MSSIKLSVWRILTDKAQQCFVEWLSCTSVYLCVKRLCSTQIPNYVLKNSKIWLEKDLGYKEMNFIRQSKLPLYTKFHVDATRLGTLLKPEMISLDFSRRISSQLEQCNYFNFVTAGHVLIHSTLVTLEVKKVYGDFSASLYISFQYVKRNDYFRFAARQVRAV